MARSFKRAWLPRFVLRTIAIVIAIAAAIDPAITTVRRGRPIVSVRAIDPSADSALALRVARQLRADARVVPARFAAADAQILVGDGLPIVEEGTRAFIVRDDTRPRVTIESLRAPRLTSAIANGRIDVTVHTVGASGRTLEVLLRNGEIAIDRVQYPIGNDEALSRVQLSFVPATAGATAGAAAGAARLRVEASIVDAASPSPSRTSSERDVTATDNLHAYADALTDVVDRPWSVLVYDPRPSWMSTFVRRALERDHQFAVTSRVVTSRNISTAAGSPPERLEELAGIQQFDAIVVGAPEALSERDVTGLEAFMRQRGGSVVFLLDQRARGAYDRLTGVGEWRYQNNGSPVSISVGGANEVALRATELLWPAVLPDGASGATQKPIIWSKPVGAGRLIVSGALDAWRFRDTSASNFGRAWQLVIAEAAGSALAPVTARLSEPLVAPGATTELSVVVRDAALTPLTSRAIRTSVSAVLEFGASDSLARTPIPLWPDGPVGILRAKVQAPLNVGSGRIVVTADGHRTEVPLVVDSIVPSAVQTLPAYSDAFAAGHGGKVIVASQLATLNSEVSRAVNAAPRRERWHPMHSVWWLLPFVLALSGEWWLRRRGSLA